MSNTNTNFAVTEQGSYFANFRHSNGAEYRGELTGCGEAFEVRNEDGEIVTTVPTNVIGRCSSGCKGDLYDRS